MIVEIYMNCNAHGNDSVSLKHVQYMILNQAYTLQFDKLGVIVVNLPLMINEWILI